MAIAREEKGKQTAQQPQTDLQSQFQSKLQEFQAMQSQLQLAAMQLQQLSLQEAETVKAMEEVEKSPGPFYRYISNILVAKDKDTLKKELAEEKDSIQLRSSAVKKQEERLRAMAEEQRKKLEEMAKTLQGQ